VQIHSTEAKQGVKPRGIPINVYRLHRGRDALGIGGVDAGRYVSVASRYAYASSFASIVILALSTLETGQPVLASPAAFWKAAASAPGTCPTTSR
jgi:hypothetical protein